MSHKTLDCAPFAAVVETKSGAIYEFANNKVRRVNADHRKRGDGDWQALVCHFGPIVGLPMILVVESLSKYGADDHGTPAESVSDVTTRRTTPVVSVSLSVDVGMDTSA